MVRPRVSPRRAVGSYPPFSPLPRTGAVVFCYLDCALTDIYPLGSAVLCVARTFLSPSRGSGGTSRRALRAAKVVIIGGNPTASPIIPHRAGRTEGLSDGVRNVAVARQPSDNPYLLLSLSGYSAGMMRIVVMYPTWGEARPFMLGSAGGTAEVWRCGIGAVGVLRVRRVSSLHGDPTSSCWPVLPVHIRPSGWRRAIQ